MCKWIKLPYSCCITFFLYDNNTEMNVNQINLRVCINSVFCGAYLNIAREVRGVEWCRILLSRPQSLSKC